MSESSTEHADPQWPHDPSEQARAADPWSQRASVLPHPGTPWDGGTRWAEGIERGRVESADGRSPWGPAQTPVSAPAPVAGVEGPHTAPGWLTRGRDGGERASAE